MLSNLWNDIRYALRTFGRSPAFAAAAVMPIALGIGINTGLFSILNSVVLRPLPTPESTELVSVHQEFRGVKQRRVHGARSMFSVPEYRLYRDGSKMLSGVMAYSRSWTVTLGGDTPREIEGELVSCNYFDVLRLRPVIGVGFTGGQLRRTDSGAGGGIEPRTLDARIRRRPQYRQPEDITLNGQTVGVVGVAPEGFDGIDITKAAFFAPTSFQRAVAAGSQPL